MLFYAIPLRSKYSSNNWSRVEQIFNQTLRSIVNQTDKEHKILVACHDIPTLENDIPVNSIEFFQVDYDPPQGFEQQMIDKFYKKRKFMGVVKEYGGGYVFPVDSDDLVSNRITRYVNNNYADNKYGWVIKRGYELKWNSKKIKTIYRFNRYCGSSYIINFKPEDLPSLADFKFNGYTRENKYLFDNSHLKWEELLGNNLKKLPFRGAMYVTNHGDNHSQITHNIGIKRRILNALSFEHDITEGLKREFSLSLND